MASITVRVHILFCLTLFNLNINVNRCVCLLATILDSISLEHQYNKDGNPQTVGNTVY